MTSAHDRTISLDSPVEQVRLASIGDVTVRAPTRRARGFRGQPPLRVDYAAFADAVLADAAGADPCHLQSLPVRERRRLMCAVVRLRDAEHDWRRLYRTHLGLDERFFAVMRAADIRNSSSLIERLREMRRRNAHAAGAGRASDAVLGPPVRATALGPARVPGYAAAIDASRKHLKVFSGLDNRFGMLACGPAAMLRNPAPAYLSNIGMGRSLRLAGPSAKATASATAVTKPMTHRTVNISIKAVLGEEFTHGKARPFFRGVVVPGVIGPDRTLLREVGKFAQGAQGRGFIGLSDVLGVAGFQRREGFASVLRASSGWPAGLLSDQALRRATGALGDVFKRLPVPTWREGLGWVVEFVDRWEDHPLWFLLSKLGMGTSRHLVDGSEDELEDVLLDALEAVVLEGDLTGALQQSVLSSRVDDVNKECLTHGLEHASGGEWVRAFPSLQIGVEGALSAQIQREVVKPTDKRLKSAVGLTQLLELEEDYQRFIKKRAYSGRAHKFRHGRGEASPRDHTLYLILALAGWANRFSDERTLHTLGSLVGDHVPGLVTQLEPFDA